MERVDVCMCRCIRGRQGAARHELIRECVRLVEKQCITPDNKQIEGGRKMRLHYAMHAFNAAVASRKIRRAAVRARRMTDYYGGYFLSVYIIKIIHILSTSNTNLTRSFVLNCLNRSDPFQN